MEQIIGFINEYGLETVLAALLINLLTALIKWPIKKCANKLNDKTKVTRFIVFLPVLLGFGVTFLYEEFLGTGFLFDKSFVTMWLTSSSLSLTFYAIVEKLFFGKSSSTQEHKESAELIEEIKEGTDNYFENQGEKSEEQSSIKILLKGKSDEKIKTQEK